MDVGPHGPRQSAACARGDAVGGPWCVGWRTGVHLDHPRESSPHLERDRAVANRSEGCQQCAIANLNPESARIAKKQNGFERFVHGAVGEYVHRPITCGGGRCRLSLSTLVLCTVQLYCTHETHHTNTTTPHHKRHPSAQTRSRTVGGLPVPRLSADGASKCPEIRLAATVADAMNAADQPYRRDVARAHAPPRHHNRAHTMDDARSLLTQIATAPRATRPAWLGQRAEGRWAARDGGGV